MPGDSRVIVPVCLTEGTPFLLLIICDGSSCVPGKTLSEEPFVSLLEEPQRITCNCVSVSYWRYSFFAALHIFIIRVNNESSKIAKNVYRMYTAQRKMLYM